MRAPTRDEARTILWALGTPATEDVRTAAIGVMCDVMTDSYSHGAPVPDPRPFEAAMAKAALDDEPHDGPVVVDSDTWAKHNGLWIAARSAVDEYRSGDGSTWAAKMDNLAACVEAIG